MAIASINPATGAVLREFETDPADVLERKLELAASTFHRYRKTRFAERAKWMLNAANLLESEKRRLAEIMTSEMGKTFASAVAEAEKCAIGCRYYAENAEKHLADEIVPTHAARSFVRFQPLGAVLAVMPWNFPFWQVFRFAAPALMAGNVCLLKHASNVPQCALEIERIFAGAGFPHGCFQTLFIESGKVEQVLKDRRVAAVTLTGSEPAGRSVASIASGQIKKSVLELGGSDPFIVMPTADFDAAVQTAVKARTQNNGQSCIAAKRFIVAASIYDRFEEAFVDAMRRLRIGDPMDPSTDVGPLATPAIREGLDAQVKEAVRAGGRLLCGGEAAERPGNYYLPTAIANVPRSSDVFREELFGPVAMLFRVETVDEAIEFANDSPFGLGSSVWSQDQTEIEAFIDELDSGQVFVNGMVASDPRLPFGGVKRSGYGRELAAFGIREFVNIKTIWCK